MYSKPDIVKDGDNALACAVIDRAVEDFREGNKMNRSTARTFLLGDAESIFEFWCTLACMNREAIQKKLFKLKKQRYQKKRQQSSISSIDS